MLPFCWLAALSTYYEELQFKLFMLSIVWNNKWLYWQLMGSFASFWLRPYRIRFSDLSDFVMRARCFVGVCECVCSMHVHVTCEGSAMTGDLLHCWCWMSDGLGEWVLLYNVSRLNERESSHQIIAQPHSVSHTHTHTRIPTHSYSCTCSLTKPTSLNRHCTSPSVLVLGGLGCRLLCYWTELSGKCPTIGCCQLVKFFCYHGCRVSCPNVSQCIL